MRGQQGSSVLCSVRTVRYSGMGSLSHFNPDTDREGEPVAAAVRHLRHQVAEPTRS